MNSMVLSVLLLVGVSIAADAQCVSGGISYEQESKCACTGATDYPGGCQNSEFGDKSCVIESYYSCGRSGDNNCTIPYTVTVPGLCGNGGDVVKRSALVVPLGTSQQERNFLNKLDADSSKKDSECAASAETFRLWLTSALKEREEKASRGGE